VDHGTLPAQAGAPGNGVHQLRPPFLKAPEPGGGEMRDDRSRKGQADSHHGLLRGGGPHRLDPVYAPVHGFPRSGAQLAADGLPAHPRRQSLLPRDQKVLAQGRFAELKSHLNTSECIIGAGE